MRNAVVAAAYRAQQISLLFPALAFQRTMRAVTRRGFRPESDTLRAVRRRYEKLLATDLANASDGLYPRSLLFQFPFTDYLRQMPQLVFDVPRTLRRLRSKNFRDLPADADSDRYPAYYKRNFHWQTDGYLSSHSARLYDIGVEWLFLGTADVMRRQVIPPISRWLRERNPTRGGEARLVDVACGTGRTLKQIAVSHPRLSLFGIDLSPYYVQAARELLADHVDASFAADNAERMPLRDESQDIATSVYLFHELPRDARERVFADMHRVVRPGGLAIVADSAQPGSSPDLAPFLERFTEDFHEPYYKGYLIHPIESGLADAGFEIESVETHFVTKLVVARKR
jgi:ubiquinone/menaquinone biosynthesis C-methylase UbiE